MALSTSARNKLQTALCSYDVADEVADAIDAATVEGTTITASAAELNKLDGASVTTAELNQLDGTILTDMTAGAGITGGTGTVCEHTVTKVGGLYKTEILIDLDGLHGGDAVNDIIGKDGGTANCHIGQITAAVNGTIVGGRVTCLETPAGGDPDIDIYGSADEATGAQDAALSTLTGEAKLIDHGDWTAGEVAVLTAMPDADGYMYLVQGAATDAEYTTGILLIELWGIAAS